VTIPFLADLADLADLDDFAARFASCSLQRAEWTHEAHLAIGAWYVQQFGPEEALPRLRTGIRRLNESFGNRNTATDGYHETVTAAYVTLIAEFISRCSPDATAQERVALLLRDPLARRDALLMYYSQPLLMSARARAEWVEPDLAPLRPPAAYS
jgi:hypothetical protein